MTIRKGQKLINYLRFDKGLGLDDAAIRRYIFYMGDDEFYGVMEKVVDYEIPTTDEGDKALFDLERVLEMFKDD